MGQIVTGFAMEQTHGLVVHSVVSVTKWLIKDSLSLLVHTESSVLTFFAKKMRGAFALQKLLSFFRQKLAVVLHIIYSTAKEKRKLDTFK